MSQSDDLAKHVSELMKRFNAADKQTAGLESTCDQKVQAALFAVGFPGLFFVKAIVEACALLGLDPTDLKSAGGFP